MTRAWLRRARGRGRRRRWALAATPPLSARREGAAAAARWTLVDQKLHDALQAIYEGRYDVAIQKCDEVLRIEPSNVIAIGRMGAAFFFTGSMRSVQALMMELVTEQQRSGVRMRLMWEVWPRIEAKAVRREASEMTGAGRGVASAA